MCCSPTLGAWYARVPAAVLVWIMPVVITLVTLAPAGRAVWTLSALVALFESALWACSQSKDLRRLAAGPMMRLAPAPVRLGVLSILQLWCSVAWPRSQIVGGSAVQILDWSDGPPPELPALPDLRNSRLSVVLACADEGSYALRTALKVVERTPDDVLEEVVVVDDGSFTHIESTFDRAGIDDAGRKNKRIRILRHPQTLGLMIAKKTGGDAARGGIIVFLDCHVSPQPEWHVEVKRLIVENPKRMVVPAITDLNIETWEEDKVTNVNTKCYLTWDAEFDWFDDESPYVPIMSGGLLALSSYWWNLTGGYDGSMRGWGGENLDQSLRSWLCGGEIMRASSSRVAHMWRTQDPRTWATYWSVGSAHTNKWRVVSAWFGPFIVKFVGVGGSRMDRFLRGFMKNEQVDTSTIQRVQQRLGCKPLVHFLHHFREIYVDGGVIPSRVFQLREKASGRCLVAAGDYIQIATCSSPDHSGHGNERQLFHWANRGNEAFGPNTCCSGLRFWGSDMCLDYVDDRNRVHSYKCDVTGRNRNQQFKVREDGRVSHEDGRCLSTQEPSWIWMLLRTVGLVSQSALATPCADMVPSNGDGVWEEINPFEPIEASIYRDQLKREGLSDAVFNK